MLLIIVAVLRYGCATEAVISRIKLSEQSDLLTVYGSLTDAIEARIGPSQLWEN